MTNEWKCCEKEPPEKFKRIELRIKHSKDTLVSVFELDKYGKYFMRNLDRSTSTFNEPLKLYEWRYL
jgi:hypothetical protein